MKILKSQNKAIVYNNRDISYRELIEKTLYLADVNSVKKDSKSIIFFENRPEWLYSLFSIWKSDAAAVLVDAGSTLDEVEYIAKDCKPENIFCSNETIDIVKKLKSEKNIKINVINVDKLDFENYSSEDVDSLEFKPTDEVAVLIYTSGTTGNPKGVMLSHGNLQANIDGVSELGVIKPGWGVLSLLPYHHAYPLMGTLLAPIHVGATIVMAKEVSSDEIFRLVKNNRVDVMIGVPRLYSLLSKGIIKQIESSKVSKKIFGIMKKIKNMNLRKGIFKKVHKKFGGNIKLMVSGGAKLDEDVATTLEVLGFHVLEGYGLTETAPIAAFNTFSRKKIGTVGRPLENVNIKIKDGEILIKGPNVMLGYYNMEEATNEVMDNGWFKTGDLGEIDDEGFVKILGRKKEIIVLPNGKNISPVEIENKILASVNYVKEVGVFDDKGILAAIIYPDFAALSRDKILNIRENIKFNIYDKCNSKVPDYKRVTKLYIVDKELPKTRLGKIRRFMLPSMIEVKKKNTELDEPTDEVYIILKDYLTDISKIDDIDISSHLELDLSLDSLDIVEFLNYIESTFGLEIQAEELSDMMVLKDLHSYILRNKKRVVKSAQNHSMVVEESEIDLNKTNEKFLKLARSILKPSLKFFFKTEVIGFEKVDRDKNYIIIANHQSFLDAQVLSTFMPLDIVKNTYSLADSINFQSKVMQYVANNANVITMDINKNLKSVVLKLEKVVKQKKNLLIFPEGAITRDGKMLPFKPMFAILAKKLNVPILPLALNGAGAALPVGKKLPKRGSEVTIEVLDIIDPSKFDNYKDIISHAEEEIKAKVKEFTVVYEETLDDK